MAGKCKYPSEICNHMTLFRGHSFCPYDKCILKDEFDEDELDNESDDYLEGYNKAIDDFYQRIKECCMYEKIDGVLFNYKLSKSVKDIAEQLKK